MEISTLQSLLQTPSVRQTSNNNTVHQAASSAVPNTSFLDQLNLSQEAMRAQETTATDPTAPQSAIGDDVRLDKVNAIRAQLESGTYATGEKLEIALERLLENLR